MGKKDKKVKEESEEPANVVDVTEQSEKLQYEEMCENVNQIAKPLASRKCSKKIYKLVKKAKKEKHHLRQGVTEVQRAIRKGERGLVIMAGDVTPIDVYCHIPGVCEENDIPYAYTPSKEQLGLAAGHKRPTIMFLIKKHESYSENFDECFNAVRSLAA